MTPLPVHSHYVSKKDGIKSNKGQLQDCREYNRGERRFQAREHEESVQQTSVKFYQVSITDIFCRNNEAYRLICQRPPLLVSIKR